MCTYMLEEDKKVIESFFKNNRGGCSFREAGADTLKCLKKGAGAKPHSILEKTIKYVNENVEDEKKAEAARKKNEIVNRFFDEFQDKEKAKELLKGLVGRWEGKDSATKITGIYVTELGKKQLPDIMKNADCLGKSLNGEAFYLKLETVEQKQKLLAYYDELSRGEKLQGKADYLFYRMFFTGDYDMHDFIVSGAQVATGQDNGEIKELQKKLYVARKEQLLKEMKSEYEQKKISADFAKIENDFCDEMNKENQSDYYRIQHGPQYNYITQMILDNDKLLKKVETAAQDKNKIEELKKNFNFIVDSVANPEFPIYMYGNVEDSKEKTWETIEKLEKLEEVYSRYGIEVKVTWKDPDEIQKHKIHILKQAFTFCLACQGKDKGAYVVNKSMEKREEFIKRMKELLNEMGEEYISNMSAIYDGDDKFDNCLYDAYFSYFDTKGQK